MKHLTSLIVLALGLIATLAIAASPHQQLPMKPLNELPHRFLDKLFSAQSPAPIHDLAQGTATVAPASTAPPALPETPIMVATSVPSGTKQANAALAALIGLTVLMVLIP